MRLTQAIHFLSGEDLTKSQRVIHYSHFVPRPEDFDLRAKLRRERERSAKFPQPKVIKVMEDLFE